MKKIIACPTNRCYACLYETYQMVSSLAQVREPLPIHTIIDEKYVSDAIGLGWVSSEMRDIYNKMIVMEMEGER